MSLRGTCIRNHINNWKSCVLELRKHVPAWRHGRVDSSAIGVKSCAWAATKLMSVFSAQAVSLIHPEMLLWVRKTDRVGLTDFVSQSRPSAPIARMWVVNEDLSLKPQHGEHWLKLATFIVLDIIIIGVNVIAIVTVRCVLYWFFYCTVCSNNTYV